MRRFVLEARKEDGQAYNPATIRSLLSGLNRVMQENGTQFSILNKADPAFRELLLTLDSITSNLHQQGVGATKNSALVISREHENMWDKGLLGFDNLRSL